MNAMLDIDKTIKFASHAKF